MADRLLDQIDFSRYQRWLNRSLGYDCPIKVLGAAGEPVWGCSGAADAELGRLVAQASDAANGPVQRLDIDAKSTLLYRRLTVGASGVRGFAAVLADKFAPADAPLEIDRMADALDDMATGIVEEASSKADLDKITEELAECYEELHLVYSLDRHNRTGVGQDTEVFRQMLQDTAAHLNVDVVAFVRPGDNQCVYATALSKEIHNLDLVLVEMRGDLFRFIQSARESVVINDEDDPRRAYIFTDMPYRVLACPIVIGRELDSLVVLLNHLHKPRFSNSDRHLGEVLANQLSAMVSQVLAISRTQKFTAQLAMAMVEAVEAKDPYTRGHSERVHHLSMEMGRALKLAEDDLQDLHWGSLLHDVGKIGIPDAILCKPARLTKDEYTFIKVHPERSYEILRHIDQLKNAVPGARHHQEMWDGEGYPHGLKGERIPLHARIMAVADTYDSITSSRAYRAGRSHEVAMTEIARVSGTQLDPSIVELFARLCATDPEPEWLVRFNIRRENNPRADMGDLVARSSLGGITYLSPAGTLAEEPGQSALAEAVNDCVRSSRIHVVLDLQRVPLINGRGLEIFHEAHDKLSFRGGSLKFVNSTTLVTDILIATRMTHPEGAVKFDPHVVHTIGRAAAAVQRSRIGDILVEMKLITEEKLAEAVQMQRTSGKQLGTILTESNTLSEADLFRALSRQTGIPYVSLRAGLYEASAIALLSVTAARRLNVLPMFKVHDTLTLATADPHAIPVLDEIQSLTGCKLSLVLARKEEIVKCQFDAFSGGEIPQDLIENIPTDIALVEQAQTDFTAIDQIAGASPVINLVNGLIQRAVRDGASDIHIECSRARGMVRFRIDGILYEVLQVRADLHPSIVSRLKVMASLDIAERRMPQDGRLQVMTQGRTIDLRFSSLAGIYGEKVVLRVLDKNQSILDVEKIGMRKPNLDLFKKLLGRSYGLLLVTGPTGSGKTTTLYAGVNHLKSIEKNIVTIEDPVEYQLDIINQNQVNEATGLGFARMLKHILRQDPDIIMVGEIRDRETAEIAVQAALTGHLVLSTLHTNDAVGALSRMMEMGVEPYMLSSALAGVVAQRLVRQVCPSCKTTFLPTPELVAAHGWPEGTRLTKGRGCTACYDSGYRGRMGIHEIIEATEELQRLMIKNPAKEELQAFAATAGFVSLYDDGILRALEGRTTVEEISRVIHAA